MPAISPYTKRWMISCWMRGVLGMPPRDRVGTARINPRATSIPRNPARPFIHIASALPSLAIGAALIAFL